MLRGPASQAPSGSTANTQMESHLLAHGRLRRLGALDEEQVEVGPLLGRGSFGRVYKGEPPFYFFSSGFHSHAACAPSLGHPSDT